MVAQQEVKSTPEDDVLHSQEKSAENSTRLRACTCKQDDVLMIIGATEAVS